MSDSASGRSGRARPARRGAAVGAAVPFLALLGSTVMCACPMYRSGGGAEGTPPSRLTPARAILARQEAHPAGLAGYGYVLFTRSPAQADEGRYGALCEAYRQLPEQREIPQATPGDIVTTFWLVRSRPSDGNAGSCSTLLATYDYGRAAGMAGRLGVAGRAGPLLVAGRRPFEESSMDDMLVLDLSDRSADDIREAMVVWSERMSMGPEHWHDGWRVENVRLTMRAALNWVTDAVLWVARPQRPAPG